MIYIFFNAFPILIISFSKLKLNILLCDQLDDINFLVISYLNICWLRLIFQYDVDIFV